MKTNLLLQIVCALALAGCVSTTVNSNSVPAVRTSAAQIPEALLLDVGVVAFDPGLDDIPEDLLFLILEHFSSLGVEEINESLVKLGRNFPRPFSSRGPLESRVVDSRHWEVLHRAA